MSHICMDHPLPNMKLYPLFFSLCPKKNLFLRLEKNLFQCLEKKSISEAMPSIKVKHFIAGPQTSTNGFSSVVHSGKRQRLPAV